jgi:hypothetical protein
MKTNTSVAIVLMATALIAGPYGCEKGPAERAGRQVDKAVDKAGQQIDKAGDKIRDAAKDAKK